MRLTMTVALPQQPSSIGNARHMLAVLLSLTTAEAHACDDLAVAVTEACANVIQHGEPGSPIDLHVVIDAGTCVLEVGNRGQAPDSGHVCVDFPDPAQLNGRGLPLLAALSDDAQFLDTPPGYVLLRMSRRLHGKLQPPASTIPSAP